MMHRLFAAIRPPVGVRAALTAIMSGIEGARWQSDNQLHLTLRFIGEVDASVAEDAALALQSVRHPPFEFGIAGLGMFDSRGRIDSLWAGVRPNPELTELHHKIDRALISIGLAPEHRAYKPHVTLARFGGRGGDAGPFLRTHDGVALPPWSVTGFGLFESHLNSKGARYVEMTNYALRH